MSEGTRLVLRKKSAAPSAPPPVLTPPPSLPSPENAAGNGTPADSAPEPNEPAPPKATLEEVWSGSLRPSDAPLATRAGLGNNLTTFRWCYVLLIVATALFAFFGHNVGEGWPLVYARFGVVLLLTFWGFRLRPADRPEAGYRVQTAGYLEALIGIGAALVPLAMDSGAEFRLQKIALPIATSLGTSILGWLLGGELVGTASRRNAAGGTGSGPAGEMGEFTLRLAEAHDRYLTMVEKITASLTQAGQAHLELVRAANESGKEGARLATDTAARIRAVQQALGESLQTLEKGTSGGLVASAEDLRKSLAEAATGLKEGLQTSRESTREFTEFLRQAKLLVQGLEEMMKYLAAMRHKP